MRFLKSCILAVLILCFFMTSLAVSATYYVDQNNSQASDNNPGTEALPWATFKKACNTVKAGDTVIVKAGEYADPEARATYPYTTFNPVNSGTSESPITFKSEPKGAAVITSKDYPGNYYQAWCLNDRAYIVIEGFKIQGGLRLYHCNHITVKNVELTRGFYRDVSLNWGIALEHTSNSLITNNYVHDMLDSGNHLHNTACIMVFGNSDYNVIEHNVTDGGGGVIYSGFGQKAGQMDHNIWRFNVARNATCGFLGMGSTDGKQVSRYNKFYQNLIINCKSAFELDHGSQHFEIFNNTAYSCPTFIKIIKNDNIDTSVWNNISVGNDKAIRYQGYPDPMPFSTVLSYCDYNNFFGYNLLAFREVSPTLYYYTLSDWRSASNFDLHSLASTPGFLDESSQDFRLAGSSPCLGTGIDRQDFDHDGDTAEHINMGCFITGNETIGVIAGSETGHSPPSAPNGLRKKD